MEEIQNRDWQYLVESVTKLVEHYKNHLKSLPKAERKIIKRMKYNYRVAQRVQASTHANIEKFIYLNSLPPDEIDEIENEFRVNINGLLSVRQTESATKLFDSFVMFYHISGRLPYTDRHLSVPDGETSLGIIGEELCLNCKIFARALQNVLGQVQVVLFHLHFLLPSLCFLPEKKRLQKIFLQNYIKI